MALLTPSFTVLVVAFTLGVGVGWTAHALASVTIGKEAVAPVIAIVIVLMWALSVTAGILDPAYSTSLQIHAIMAVVAGYFFGEGIRLKTSGGRGHDDHP